MKNFSFQKILQKIEVLFLKSVRQSSSPLRDWKRVLLVFLLISIAFILWSTYLFWGIRTGELFEVGPASPSEIETLDRELLREVLLNFEKREEEYGSLLEETPTFPNPLR